MKKIIYLVIVLFLTISYKANACNLCFSKSIAWQYSMKDAQRISKASRKPILAFFGPKWCSVCKPHRVWIQKNKKLNLLINRMFVPLLVTDYVPEGYKGTKSAKNFKKEFKLLVKAYRPKKENSFSFPAITAIRHNLKLCNKDYFVTGDRTDKKYPAFILEIKKLYLNCYYPSTYLNTIDALKNKGKLKYIK